MVQLPDFFSKEDELTFGLPVLFENRGYKKYRMSKFEEYSFYSDNRKFLTVKEGAQEFVRPGPDKDIRLEPQLGLRFFTGVRLPDDLDAKVPVRVQP